MSDLEKELSLKRGATNLRTSRLLMEAIVPAHAPMLFEGLCDEALYQFIDDGPPESVESLRTRYERWAGRLSPDGQEVWLNWALRIPATDNYVGTVQATIRKDYSATIAYVLFRSAWGRGYAQEAVEQMIEHLDHVFTVKTFLATVDPRNERSIRLLQALGFERTAFNANASTIRGLPTDESQYSFRIPLDA